MSPPLEPDSLLEDTVPQNMNQAQVTVHTKPGPCGLDGGGSPSTREDNEPFSKPSSEATGAALGSPRQSSPPHPSSSTTTNSDDSGEEEDSFGTRGSTGEAGAGACLDSQDDKVGSGLTGVCRVDSIDLGYFFFLLANLYLVLVRIVKTRQCFDFQAQFCNVDCATGALNNSPETAAAAAVSQAGCEEDGLTCIVYDQRPCTELLVHTRFQVLVYTTSYAVSAVPTASVSPF